MLFGVGAVFPGDVVGGPGTVKFVCLGVSVGVHHPHQSGHPLGLLHHPQAPFGVAALFPIRDTGFIDFILQLPGQRTEPIHLQGERFDTQVLRVASAAVGTESEGDPNSGGRLPECALCGHPHKFLGGAVRCGARCGAVPGALRQTGTTRLGGGAVGTLTPAATAHTASARRRSSPDTG